jgi:beta-lactamase class A
MRRIHRGTVTMVAAGGCVAALVAAAAIPATASAATTTTSICTSARHPRIAGRISGGIAATLRNRPGSFVGLAASDPALHLTCSLRSGTHFYSASVIKVTILSALLLKKGGPGRLTSYERHEAYLMITASDNNAATYLWDDVGFSHLQTFLNRAGMGQTILDDAAWGLSLITPHDELLLLQLLSTPGTVLNNRSRNYVLSLMAQVVSYERWGVSAAAPANVTVHIKNGWLPYPGSDDWRINSIGTFTGTNISYQIVILTAPPNAGGQGESYGIQTIELAATVINRNLAGKSPAGLAPLPPPGEDVLEAPGG